jgi:general secretion pathway protein M
MEPLRKLRADLEAWFSRLAPRERVMVSAAAGAVAAFVLFLVFTSVQHRIAAREASIDRKTQVIAQVGKLAQGYRQVQAERAQLEAKLKGPPLQLMSFVAQTGQRLGIEVNDLRPGTPGATGAAGAAGATDKVVEDTVEVNLAKLDLSRLAALLQELERGPGVVKVRRLALRTRSDDPNAVDATIVIATYQLKG